MNGNIKKWLQSQAEGLPPILGKRVFVDKKIFGYQMPKERTHDEEGNPIQPMKKYDFKETVVTYVDHFEQLKKVYNAGGSSAVTKYRAEVFRKHGETQAASQKPNTDHTITNFEVV